MNVLSFSIAKIVERLPQGTQINVFLLGAASVPEDANNGNLVQGTLCTRREWPGERRPAERRNEFPLTELGYMAKIKPEFDKRGVKIIGLSVDPVDKHTGWAAAWRDRRTRSRAACRTASTH
jgi:hypothetical protein